MSDDKSLEYATPESLVIMQARGGGKSIMHDYVRGALAEPDVRGSGRTTKQLQDAPRNAVFICHDYAHAPNMHELCRKIGRRDLQLVGQSWLQKTPWRDDETLMDVRFDHDCRRWTSTEKPLVDELVETLERRRRAAYKRDPGQAGIDAEKLRAALPAAQVHWPQYGPKATCSPESLAILRDMIGEVRLRHDPSRDLAFVIAPLADLAASRALVGRADKDAAIAASELKDGQEAYGVPIMVAVPEGTRGVRAIALMRLADARQTVADIWARPTVNPFEPTVTLRHCKACSGFGRLSGAVCPPCGGSGLIAEPTSMLAPPIRAVDRTALAPDAPAPAAPVKPTIPPYDQAEAPDLSERSFARLQAYFRTAKPYLGGQ
jgi:hypothetical protein